MRKLFTPAIFFIPFIAFSQVDTLASKQLEEVVITGQYKPQSLRNSVYQVRTINNERIRLSGATTVQQVLSNQLGIRFSNDNTLGTTDVQLMGMSGRNVKILLDGVPLVDRGDTRESLGQVDINTIDRIEIVEGPMAVSYGSDALAGVINIITRVNRKDGYSVFAKVQEETAGSTYHPFSYKGSHLQHIGFTVNRNKWNFSLGGTHNDFNGFGGDAYGRGKTWRPKEQWSGNSRIGFRNSVLDIYYRVDGLHEEISSRGPINMSAFTALDQYYVTRRYMHQVQSNWRVNNRLQWTAMAAFTNYRRRTKTFIHDFTTGLETAGTQAGQQDVSGFSSLVFRNTLNYTISSKVSLQPGIDINHEQAEGARIKGKPSISDYALFVSSEIKLNDRINLRPGLRVIKNSVYDAPPVIPSFNSKIRLSRSMDLRFAYAFGFRSPALRELYFNFIDGSHTIIGNPGLKAETSNSFNASLSWTGAARKDIPITLTAGGFYNVFNDLINYASSPTSGDTTITVNVDKFRTTGATLENKITWKDLSATIGLSYIGRYNDLSANEEYKNEDLPVFVWTPEINSNIIYTAKKIKTSFGLFYKFTGRRPGYEAVFNNTTGKYEVRSTHIESFQWADLTVTRPFFKSFTATAGIKNIFDVTSLANSSISGGTHNGGGAIVTAYGRSYFLGLSFELNKK